MGVFWIENKTVRFKAEDYPKLELRQHKNYPIIVSNHISLLDILYHLQKGDRCFIAK